MRDPPSRRPRRRRAWRAANELVTYYDSATSEADTSGDEAGTTAQQTQQPFRSTNMSYAPQSNNTRQAPRLQNTQKSALGNGTGGWGSFGVPGGGFGGLGGAPGFGAQGRPGQLSGFAQVMGGGSGQGPIDMSMPPKRRPKIILTEFSGNSSPGYERYSPSTQQQHQRSGSVDSAANIPSASDFPSLSGGPRPQQGTSGTWNSSAIRQPSVSQPPPQQAQQRAPSAAPSQQSVEQYDGQRSQHPPGAGGGDEFPPLGGQVNGDGSAQSNGFSSGFGSPDVQQPRPNGQQSQLPIRDASSTFQQSQQAPIGQPSSQQSQQPSQNTQPPPSSSSTKKYGDLTESEKWGLQGLMAAFESRKQVDAGGQPDETLPPGMRSAILMGHDLSSLGMDLDSNEPLYPTFHPFQVPGSSGSSFDYHDRHVIPDFTLPAAYTVTNVPPLNTRMSAFSDETLFTIFYQYPRDIRQELAANELVNRDWRYHKILRQWLQKDTRESNSNGTLQMVDHTNGAPIGAPPIRKSERVEQGVYVFFDAMNWRRERRWLDLDYDSLDPPRVTAAINGTGQALGNGGPAGLVGLQSGGAGSSQIPSA